MSRRRFFRSVASNWARLGWDIVWGIVMVPIMIGYLGAAPYGVWVLIHAVVGYYGLLDLGVHAAVIRHIARSIGLRDRSLLNEVFNSALVLQTCLGLLAFAVSVALALILPRVQGFAASSYPDAGLLLTIVGGSVASAFVSAAFRGALHGAERYDLTNLIQMAGSLLRNVGFIVVLHRGGGLVAIAWVHLVTAILEKPALIVAALRTVPGLTVAPTRFRRSRLAEVFRFSIHAFAINAGERLRFFTDTIVIGAFLAPEAITLFRVGSRPLQFLTNVVRGISRVIMPTISRTEAEGRGNLSRILVVGTRATALVASLGCVVLAVAGDRLIRLWLGEGFGESVTILLVLLPAYFIETTLAPTGSTLFGTDRVRVLSWVSILEGAINLALSLVLIRWFGLIGVALGTAMPMIVFRLFVVPFHACRKAGISLTYLFAQVWRPVAPALLASVAAGWLLARRIESAEPLPVLALVGTVCAVYLAVGFVTLWLRRDDLLPRRLVRAAPPGRPGD